MERSPLALLQTVLLLVSLGTNAYLFFEVRGLARGMNERIDAIQLAVRPGPAGMAGAPQAAGQNPSQSTGLTPTIPSPEVSKQTPIAQSPAGGAAAILDLESMSPEERKKKDPAWVPGHDDGPAKADGDNVYLLSGFPPVNKDGDLEEQYLNILRAFQSRHQVGGSQERIETAREFLALKKAARSLGPSIGTSPKIREVEGEIERRIRSN